MSAMGRGRISHYGVVPREHAPGKPPPLRQVARAPGGNPMTQASVAHVGRPPKPHRVGAPPNPRRPKLVRDVDGGPLQDLFAIFPDLPWPRHLARSGGHARDVRGARGRAARRAFTRPVR
jgi:hypothetical protein